MEGDLIIKNMDTILNEKKVLNENTEQETHLKIYNLLDVMKKAIKPAILYKKEEDKKDVKILTENEIEKAKDFVGNKIIKEQNIILNNINNYVNKFTSTFMNDNYKNIQSKGKIKRDFNRFVESLNFQKDIKLINYKKPKPIPIRDKESANLLKIKKLLYPTTYKIKEVKESINRLRRNSSMNDIYEEKRIPFLGKTANNISTLDKIKNIDVSGQDTMQILNQLAEQKNYMSERMEQKLRRVNSLIEVKLPYLNNYELILNYIKGKNKSKILSKGKKENNSNETIIFSPLSEYSDSNIMLKPHLKQKLLALKKDIESINQKSEIFFKKYFKDKSIALRNKIKGSIDLSHLKEINKKGDESSRIIENNKKSENVFITEKK
jgi:hypothetical protein